MRTGNCELGRVRISLVELEHRKNWCGAMGDVILDSGILDQIQSLVIDASQVVRFFHLEFLQRCLTFWIEACIRFYSSRLRASLPSHLS